MSRHRLVFNGTARFVLVVGYDHPAMGFFLTIHGPGRPVVYDSTRPGYEGIPGLLACLVAARVVSEADVATAKNFLAHAGTADMNDDGVRLVATIVTMLRRDAGEAGPQ